MSMPRLYSVLAEWWPLFSPVEHYAEEADFYHQLFTMVAGQPPASLLELGSGCGPLAANLPAALDITLVDYAPEMIAISKTQNPGRTHVCADMRDLDLGRTFDAILLHDAVMYLTDEDSVRRTFSVMAAHCAPGGVIVVVPDAVRETFEEFATSGGWGDASGRAMQMMEWHWDPDPEDDTIQVAFSLLLRGTDGTVRAEHEQHTMGLYSRTRYQQLIEAAGFELVQLDAPESALRGELFVARKIATAPGRTPDSD